MNLKTLLYGYSLVTIHRLLNISSKATTKDDPAAPWFALSKLLEFYDMIEPVTIRDCALGGRGLPLILEGGILMRQEWKRLNSASPDLAGDEIIAAVIAGRAVLLPTNAALLEAKNKWFAPKPSAEHSN